MDEVQRNAIDAKAPQALLECLDDAIGHAEQDEVNVASAIGEDAALGEPRAHSGPEPAVSDDLHASEHAVSRRRHGRPGAAAATGGAEGSSVTTV